MTDKPSSGTRAATTEGPSRGSARRSRRSPLAVAGASLAAFLAVLTLLAAQLHAGHDPALGSSVAAVAQQGGKPVVTRTSGGGSATAPKAGAGSHVSHHPITTRASGGEGGEDD